MTQNTHLGASFDDFLEEEGILQEVTLEATKKVLALAFAQIIEKQKISKSALARDMKTSVNQVNRLLDEDDTGITLKSIFSMAKATNSNVKLVIESNGEAVDLALA